MLRHLPSLNQTNASSSSALASSSRVNDDALFANDHICFVCVLFCCLNTFKLCCILLLWVLLLPSNATSCHILCVYLVPRVQVSIGRCHHPAFTTYLIVVLFWLHSFDVLTCMCTHIVVSSCHLNAVRSLSYSADCLSIGCVNTCVYSFVRHFIPGCDIDCQRKLTRLFHR